MRRLVIISPVQGVGWGLILVLVRVRKVKVAKKENITGICSTNDVV